MDELSGEKLADRAGVTEYIVASVPPTQAEPTAPFAAPAPGYVAERELGRLARPAPSDRTKGPAAFPHRLWLAVFVGFYQLFSPEGV